MKSVLATLLLIFSVSLYAQKDVTQFLGIPVDGSKSEMIKNLKQKALGMIQQVKLYWESSMGKCQCFCNDE